LAVGSKKPNKKQNRSRIPSFTPSDGISRNLARNLCEKKELKVHCFQHPVISDTNNADTRERIDTNASYFMDLKRFETVDILEKHEGITLYIY
jgi:hypothetical protein